MFKQLWNKFLGNTPEDKTGVGKKPVHRRRSRAKPDKRRSKNLQTKEIN
jgi:hypothetical protein